MRPSGFLAAAELGDGKARANRETARMRVRDSRKLGRRFMD
jgi:hypothetical protein